MSSDTRARFRSLLQAEAAGLGIQLGPAHLNRLQTHFALLEKWNPRVHLIGTTDPAEVVRRHTLESLALLPHIPLEAGSLLDIGSGNGFPGLVIKCVREDLELVLLEPTHRKAVFLEQVVVALGLERVQIMRARVDRPGDLLLPGKPARWGCITMRAVSAFDPVMRGARDALRPGGRLLLPVGRAGREEVLGLMGAGLKIAAEVRLPHRDSSWLLVIERLDD